MPDHLHAAIALESGHDLAGMVRSLKSFTARAINRTLSRSGAVWQRAYHDHALRDREDFERRLAYMHANPVRAGLAARPEGYEFSTAHPRRAGDIDRAWIEGGLPFRI